MSLLLCFQSSPAMDTVSLECLEDALNKAVTSLHLICLWIKSHRNHIFVRA